jgi:hypothetical protein
MSILESIESTTDSYRSFTVQISDGGQVTLSFDGRETNTSVYMTAKELKAFEACITKALHQRADLLNEELKNE